MSLHHKISHICYKYNSRTDAKSQICGIHVYPSSSIQWKLCMFGIQPSTYYLLQLSIYSNLMLLWDDKVIIWMWHQPLHLINLHMRSYFYTRPPQVPCIGTTLVQASILPVNGESSTYLVFSFGFFHGCTIIMLSTLFHLMGNNLTVLTSC